MIFYKGQFCAVDVYGHLYMYEYGLFVYDLTNLTLEKPQKTRYSKYNLGFRPDMSSKPL